MITALAAGQMSCWARKNSQRRVVHMKVLIFGATGSTGKLIVQGAREWGHQVTAFVRDPSKLDRSDVHFFHGDVNDLESLRQAIAGKDAVISALGSRSMKRDPDLVAGVRNIVEVMQESDAKRLIYMSSMGVGDSKRQLGFFGRHVVAPLLLRNALADHAENESAITSSDLRWTIVRPTQLTDGPQSEYRSGEGIRASDSSSAVSRASVAHFMLDQLESEKFVGAKPTIMT